MTKHEQIIQHIISLPVGEKISVRSIARTMEVSEGTAYRAIKEAENQGLVSTIERVGTIRIEKKRKEYFEQLTFAEVINIVDGQVLGGRDGLYKKLNKFVIGAMQLDAMARYTEPDSLLIVGNRADAQELALNDGAAVLITGGFDTTDKIKKLADDKELPLLSTSYDTFTVASMINRAIYDQLIKKEIVFVGDILTPFDDTHSLHVKNRVSDWYELNRETEHTRFPVLDTNNRVVGMVTSRDIIGNDDELSLERVMTKNPLVVQEKTSLAYVAHMMVWEGIQLVPVVDQTNKMLGIVSRQDVIQALQQIQRQPQIGETIDDIITKNIQVGDEESTFKIKILPQMTNQLGTLSNGVFTSLVTEGASRLLHDLQKGDLVVENLSVFFFKPVPIDSEIIIKPRLLDAGRMYAKVDVDVFCDKKLVGKALVMAQIMDK
ncbi:MAG TPA: DRTGG domain-containing protein [Cerasibacillus sp.]|uniref:DRTGG domain-containing protein n=1 Tax=Cerasibacillus sp. TaxID=2498711 RepID=UPI002F3FAB55